MKPSSPSSRKSLNRWIIKDQIDVYFDNDNALHYGQFGFRSTYLDVAPRIFALPDHIESFTNNFSDGKSFVFVSPDSTKAFYRATYAEHINKLHDNFNFPSNVRKLMWSYVKLKTICSSERFRYVLWGIVWFHFGCPIV